MPRTKHFPPVESFSIKEKYAQTFVLPKLLGTVFHVTSHAAYKKILNSGKIRPNRSGRLGSGGGATTGNYGNFKNYVCLFDFRNKSPDEINNAINFCWNFFHQLGNRIVFLFVNASLFSSLIGQETMKQEVGYTKRFIPGVECWHPKPIPLAKIDRVIKVTIVRKPIDPNSLIGILMKSRKRIKKSKKYPNLLYGDGREPYVPIL